jgi:sporulation protein YabP
MTYTDNHLAQRTRTHSIKVDGREKTVITGVEDVDNFNESEINIITTAGYLTLIGSDLHITRLNLDEGQLMIEGYVGGVNYSDNEPKSEGFFGRMFK